DTPEPIRRLLRRCLQKELKLRLHDVADARLEIEDARQAAPAAERVAPAKGGGRERLAWISAVALVAAVAAVLTSWMSRTRPAFPATRLELANPPTINPVSAALSPDGRSIVFNGTDEPSPLWLRSLDSGVTRPLTGTEGGYFPFWSPDGKHLGFYTSGDNKL